MNLHQRLLVLILLLLAAPVAWWLARGLDDPPRPDELLPADTLLFMHWNDMARFAGQVAASPMARQLARADFQDTLRQLGVEETVTDRFARRLQLVQSLQGLPLVPELLAGRGMLALLPNRSASSGLLPSLCASMVFFLPEDTPLLANRQLQLLPDPPGQKLAYLGLPIRRYRLQDGRILYTCQAYGLTLCAFAREALAHCLDQAVLHMIGGIQAAHGEKAWLTRHRRLPDKAGEFFCYANIAGLRVQPLWASALEPLWQDMPPEQAIIDHRVRSRADSLNLTLRFAPGVLDAWRQERGLATAGRPPAAASQDAATLLHLWSNWLTPAVAAKVADLISSTELGAPLLAAAGNFLGRLSFTPDRFYRHFAPELGLVIRGERNQNNQMKPLFALYSRFTTGLSAQEQNDLKRHFQDFPKRTVSLSHGSQATVIGMADGMMQPAIAPMFGQLVLADNLYMLQHMENQLAAGGEEAVAPEPQTEWRAPLRASVYLFLRNRQVADAGAWLLRYLSSARNERGVAILSNRQKLFVHQVALPFAATIGLAESSHFALAVSGNEAQAMLECIHPGPAPGKE